VDDIKITAEPSPNGRSCKFVVDRPVYAEGSAWFGAKDRAAESPLAARIFEIETVTGVLIAGNTVTVNAGPFDDWRPAAKQVAVCIRDVLRSGGPAVGASYRQGPGREREAEIRRKVQEVLDTQINPAIAAHGGAISLVDVQGDTVVLTMSGGCQGCASSQATLRLGVENAIREAVPEVGDIVDATDHAAGANPYYH
jgi:Fe-S cluster biogenesis protein NfuA